MGDDLERLAAVATLYHVRKLTQQQIATRMGFTRQTIARLLARAEEEEVVKIDIRGPRVEAMRLEAELSREFDLVDTFVVESAEESSRRNEEIGEGCWKVISRNLKANDILALGWRRTLGVRPDSVRASGRAEFSTVTVVQADGGVAAPDEQVNPTFAISSLAAAMNARCHIIQSPQFTRTAHIADELRSDSVVSLALEVAARSDIICFGVGALTPGDILFATGQVGEDDRTRLRAEGAVGDILGQFFDVHGEIVDPDLAKRTIALDHDSVRKVPMRIGVCPGPSRVEATRVALRSGLANALVLDVECATDLLNDTA